MSLTRSRKSFLEDHDGKASFEPQEFLAEEFSVDEFIQNKRIRVPLDVLRDDLGSHLKFLRSSLIELINQDYGQFVNLSSNLVGLDGRIQNISGPLLRAKSDLSGVVKELDSNIESLKQEENLKKHVRRGKKQLQLHRMVLLAVQSAEKHMRRVPVSISTDSDLAALSSTCEEIANAQFLIQNCEESPMSSDMTKRLNTLMGDALQRMNALLKFHSSASVTAHRKDNEVVVIKLLHLYVELQKVQEAEQIFMLNVLKPICDEILSKKGNVSSLLDEVENFILNCPTIQISKQLEQYAWMTKYNFLSNCVLPYVVNLMKKHFPHIWSPSNPDTFHSNWARCEKFLNFLEDMMPSLDHLEVFRGTDAVKEFLSKWQFPVYFQLRFHSLTIELESALDNVTAPCVNSDFKLDSTRVMVKVLKQCWDTERIFIHQIAGRFLKASALIVSRYIKALEVEVTSQEDVAITLLLEIYCDLKLAEFIVQQIIAENLHVQLSNPSTETDYDTSSIYKLPVVAQGFFEDFRWQQTRSNIEDRLVQITINQSYSSISLVTEVPRLYRRTNRDTPTKHGEYVDGILQPINSLKTVVQQSHQGDLWEDVGLKVASQISERYKSQVDEVLTSVLRMEESLKRLKKVKNQSIGGPDSSKVLSDDDKIRMQIQIDMNYFQTQIQALCPSVDTEPLTKVFDKTNGTS